MLGTALDPPRRLHIGVRLLGLVAAVSAVRHIRVPEARGSVVFSPVHDSSEVLLQITRRSRVSEIPIEAGVGLGRAMQTT